MSTHVTAQPRVRKRLIVCCDGTWQSSVSGERNVPSNVTRMCRHLLKNDTVEDANGDLWKQVVHYDAGVGTGKLSAFDVNLQGGTGLGLAQNVIEAYNFLALNYQARGPNVNNDISDKIYCFGFSRGAYTARALSGFITSMGICSPMDMQAFPYIYNLYENAIPYTAGEKPAATEAREALWGKGWTTGEPVEGSVAWNWMHGKAIEVVFGDKTLGKQVRYLSGHRKPIDPESRNVEVVGVWDTVGALGIPPVFGWIKPRLLSLFTKLDEPGREFHDVSIHPRVKHAFHALALDERRKPFVATLWYVPKDEPRASGTSFKQVWFPGCHINIGGGSDDVLKAMTSDFEQIANITFAWMVEQVRPHLAFDEESFITAIKEQKKLLRHLETEELPWPEAWLFKFFTAPTRFWCYLTRKPAMVTIPRPGWATGRITRWPNGSPVMFFGGRTIRAPGESQAIVSNGNKKDVKSLLGEDGLAETTGEEIHPCVWPRIDMTKKWHPALRDWRRERDDASGLKRNHNGWVWRKGDNLAIPEYVIGPARSEKPNLERLVAEAYGASAYLARLDKVLYEGGNDETGKGYQGDMQVDVFSGP